MALIRLSSEAEADIEAILAWTHTQFGDQARLRYEELLVRSILDIAENPNRLGALNRPELAASAFTYHLFHSRDRVKRAKNCIDKPRHFLLYRIDQEGCLEIARVLHDSMELARHIPFNG